MDRYEQILLDAAKDTVNALKEEGLSNKEIENSLNDLLKGTGERSPEFTKEIKSLTEKTGLDDLIKGATDKSNNQTTIEKPTKDLER